MSKDALTDVGPEVCSVDCMRQSAKIDARACGQQADRDSVRSELGASA